MKRNQMLLIDPYSAVSNKIFKPTAGLLYF